MNLPLNMRSAIVDCIANYLPGGVIRTGLGPDRDFQRNEETHTARLLPLSVTRLRAFFFLSASFSAVLLYYL